MATYNLHRMGLLLLVFTKLSIIDGVTGDDCTPTNRPNIKCTLEKNSAIACDESGLAYQYVVVGWPSKPLNFEIVTTSTQNGNRFDQGVNVSWQAPQDASLKNLKGFLLRFVGVEHRMSDMCWFFNLTEANWTNEDILNPNPLMFDISLPNITANSYFVELTGVPRSPASLETTSVFKTIRVSASYVHSKDNTWSWYSNIVYDIDNENHKIHVTFQLPPPDYGFKYYDVMLIPKGSNKAHEWKKGVEVDTSASRHVVTFADVCEGAYYIDLIPRTGENKSCVCLMSGRCVSRCMRTRTIVFNVTGSCLTTTIPTTTLTHSPTIPPKIPSTLVSKEAPSNTVAISKTGASRPRTTGTPIDGPALAGIIIGIIAAVGLLLVTGYLLYSRRWKASCAVNGPPLESKMPIVTEIPFTPHDKKDRHPKNGPKNNRDKPQGCEEITEKRRILIIYHPDHERHETVVMKFANYLYKLCGCEVYLDKWCQTDIQGGTISEWLHDHIKWAEKIIIINSEGAYKKWHAAKEGNIFEKRVGKNPGGDIFLPAIRMLHQELGEGKVDYSRYISAHFEYTAAEFDLPTLSVGSSNYNLMKHIETLFFHIHRINKDEPGVEQEAVEINEEYFNYTPEGFDLHNSILEAGRFQRDHPNWFDQIYELRERKNSGLESMPSGYRTSDDYEGFNNNRPKVIIPSDFSLSTDLPNGIYVPTPTPEEGSKSLPYVFIHPPDLHEDVTSLDGKPASAIMREVNTGAPFFGNDNESIDCRTIYKENIDFGQDDDDVRSVASLEV